MPLTRPLPDTLYEGDLLLEVRPLSSGNVRLIILKIHSVAYVREHLAKAYIMLFLKTEGGVRYHDSGGISTYYVPEWTRLVNGHLDTEDLLALKAFCLQFAKTCPDYIEDLLQDSRNLYIDWKCP